MELFSRVGGGGENFVDTDFDEQAGRSIVTGTAPFTGTFRPEGRLTNFNGEDPRGTWTLEIVDVVPGFEGWLDSVWNPSTINVVPGQGFWYWAVEDFVWADVPPYI